MEPSLPSLTSPTLPDDELDDFNKGFAYDKGIPDITSRGHVTISDLDTQDPKNCPKVVARATFSQYLLFPTKHSFPKTVRVLAICVRFLKAFTAKYRKKLGTILEPPRSVKGTL